ncbi:replication initiator [Kitasatospora acidiphila]|uniref:replication initiator n=1 Tax=Kitasatospora acidiphila TaxID=2567942 RepID=UPI003C708C20
MNGNPFESREARRLFLEQQERLRRLSAVDRDLVRLGQMPRLDRWLEQIEATGGCEHPVYLTGRSSTFDAVSGELLRQYSTDGEPGGRLAVRCRNRRATVCLPCSRLYQGDAWQLVRAGLAGGKGVPVTVTRRPMVFATLTAPSFGAVHRAGRCRRRRAALCDHGVPLGCGRHHHEESSSVGQPLCPACYDYVAHVLWHAHAGRLWKAFTDNLYHHLGVLGGVGRSGARRQLRVSAAKVAEFQRRGAVHFHAVLRIDGPQSPGAVGPVAAAGGTVAPALLENEPPEWASVDVLVAAVRSAAGAVALSVPDSTAYAVGRLAFGVQVEVHAITGGGGRLTDERVAAYVAKYTTKSAEAAGALDHRITSVEQIPLLSVSDHVRALVGTAWRLGGLAELEHLRLRLWAHMFGYRGHCLTKTRAYSTTFRQLRADRARFERRHLVGSDDEITVGEWRFAGSGHSPAEALIAAGIAEDLHRARELARDHLTPGWVGGARRGPRGAGGPGHPGSDHDLTSRRGEPHQSGG